MNNRNKIISMHMIDGDCLVLETAHFTVHINKIDFGTKSIPSKQSVDTLLVTDYHVSRRTSYATNYNIKKFLRKLSMNALRHAIATGSEK